MLYKSPFKVDKAKETLSEISKYDGVIIFGTGNCGNIVIAALKKANINIICLADNNRSRWGTIYNGHKVISPKELNKILEDDSSDKPFIIDVREDNEIAIASFSFSVFTI